MPADIKSEYTYNQETGLFVRKDTQDCDEVFKQNAIERQTDTQFAPVNHKIASIPMVVLEDWKNRHGLDWLLIGTDPHHTGLFLRLLKDPDNYKFRTSEGNLGDGSKFCR